MEKKISISQIREVAQEAYDEVKKQTGGKNADYIPYLANIDSDLFGLSICLTNGQTINIGDTDYRFGIESVSKVHTAILILRQYGAQKVLDMIGADATACHSTLSLPFYWRTTTPPLHWSMRALYPLVPWCSRRVIPTRNGMSSYRTSPSCAALLHSSSTSCTNRRQLRISITVPLHGY